MRLGLSPFYKGYNQLVCVMRLALAEDAPERIVAQDLYKQAAAQLGCDYKSIERNIRTLIKRAREIDPEFFSHIAGHKLHGRIGSAQFIDIMRSYAKRHTHSWYY